MLAWLCIGRADRQRCSYAGSMGGTSRSGSPLVWARVDKERGAIMPRWVNRPENSNWGDFGEDDQIGRMNLLTPELRRAALAEAREGIAFTLSMPLNVPTIPFNPPRQPPVLCASPDEEGGMFN